MNVRLANNCVNCKSLTSTSICNQHQITVTAKHTCDSFSMSASLKNQMDCTNCVKYNKSNCSHPAKAAADMLCSSWAPAEVA